MERKIPKKNYIIYTIIVIVTLLLVLYLNSWYKAYKQKQLDESYISKYIHEINYTEFKNYSIENPNLIVYIGTTNCENCLKVEKDLYKVIKHHDLKSETIFININNLSNIELLEKEFNQKDLKFNYSIPSIAILKNSKIVDVLSIDDQNNIKKDLIIQLLEEHEYIK